MTRSEPRRLPRGLTVVMGVGVGVALVLSGVVVTAQVRHAVRTSELQAAVDAAYATARPESDRRRAAGDALLAGLVGPATLRSSTLTCTLGHSDSGLMVTRWSQQCTIRTVDVYPTTLSYADVSARIESAARDQGLDAEVLGAEVPGSGVSDSGGAGPAQTECGPVRTTGDAWATGPQVTVTRLQAGAFHPDDPDRDLATDCQVAVPVYDIAVTRVDSSFAREAVTADRSWVVVERRTPFVDHDLECAGLLLCRAPVDSVRLPRP